MIVLQKAYNVYMIKLDGHIIIMYLAFKGVWKRGSAWIFRTYNMKV